MLIPTLQTSRLATVMRRYLRGASMLALLPVLAACAAATAGHSALPSPAEIPGLEAHLTREPTSVPTQVRLGIAYREANRPEDARVMLERAASQRATDPAAVFYLGLTYEELNLPAEARELYERYLEAGKQPQLKLLIRHRMPLLERQELLLAVRSALAREAELAQTLPQPHTVAVFPFAYLGQSPELRPLSRAMAEMLVTDLSQTERLTVLERSRVQLLLDEIQLGQSELIDPATAARGGRLLAAGRIIQGRIDGDEALLRLQAAVVGLGGEWDGRPLTEEDALRRLFELQKRLALGIYRSLGVELTAAERERVLEQPTQNLEALLAYGQCLEAEDAGDFDVAARHCAQAATFDPGFLIARQRAERAEQAAAAMQATTAELALLGMGEFGPEVWADAPPFEALDAIRVLVPEPAVRNPAAEILGTERFGRSTILEIILRRP